MAVTVRRSSLLVLLLALVAGCSTGTASGTGGPAGPEATDPPASAGAPRASASSAAPSAAAPSGLAGRPVESAEAGTTVGDRRADDVPSRIVIDALDIDLPVVSGDLVLEGNPSDYPLCDVAQYLTTYRYPGRPGTTTWIYAHARRDMFLPLLDASTRDAGAELVGGIVEVYSTADIRYTYRLTEVLPHSIDRSSAADVPEGEGRLVLQTSEGPSGTVPKLQVVGVLEAVSTAAGSEAQPSPAPRVCG